MLELCVIPIAKCVCVCTCMCVCVTMAPHKFFWGINDQLHGVGFRNTVPAGAKFAVKLGVVCIRVPHDSLL